MTNHYWWIQCKFNRIYNLMWFSAFACICEVNQTVMTIKNINLTPCKAVLYMADQKSWKVPRISDLKLLAEYQAVTICQLQITLLPPATHLGAEQPRTDLIIFIYPQCVLMKLQRFWGNKTTPSLSLTGCPEKNSSTSFIFENSPNYWILVWVWAEKMAILLDTLYYFVTSKLWS